MLGILRYWAMLTLRGWWFLLTSLFVLVSGIFAGLPSLVLVGLSLILALAVIGGSFYVQTHLLRRPSGCGPYSAR